MRRNELELVEPYWPTLGATGQIAQLSDTPRRKRKSVPFGFQPPAPPKPKPKPKPKRKAGGR